MKKVLSIVLVLVMVFSLAACGGPKPEDTVKSFCESMKAFDFEGMNAVLADKLSEDEVINEEIEEELPGLIDYMKSCSSLMTYTVGKAGVNGDTAVVPVEFKFRDTTEVVKAAMQKMFTMLFKMMFSGEGSEMTEEEEAKLLSELFMETAPTELPETTASVNFNLQKVDKEWKVTEMTDDMVNVLTCNMVKAMENLEESDFDFEEMMGEDWVGEDGEFDWGSFGGDFEAFDYPISNEVLFDNEALNITLTSADCDEWGMSTFNFDITNKTDTDYDFQIDYISINGWTDDMGCYDNVPAGETVSDYILIDSYTLDSIGAESPDQVGIFFKASAVDFESEDWEEVIFADGASYFYPTGLSADDIPEPEMPESENAYTVIDDENVKFVILGLDQNEYGSYFFNIYLENRTDRAINFSWEDVRLNGENEDIYFDENMPAGGKRIAGAGFYPDNLENVTIDSIDDIESIAFTMYGIELENWEYVFEGIEGYYEP